MPRRRPEFEPGFAGAEAAKLKKFSDAGGTQIKWLPDAGRIQVSSRAQYKFDVKFKEWNYAIRGKTIDKIDARIIISFNKNGMIIITAIAITRDNG